MSDHDDSFDLVMPFVNVTSVGGRFDDDAYCAGYEMGRLDSRLAIADAMDAQSLVALYLTANAGQADLIAMRHGFRVDDRLDHDGDSLGWTHAVLKRGIDG